MKTQKFNRPARRILALFAVVILVSTVLTSSVSARGYVSAGVVYAVDQSLRTGKVDSVKVWLSNGIAREGSAEVLRQEFGWFAVSPPVSCSWSGLFDMPTPSGSSVGWGCTLPDSVNRPSTGSFTSTTR